MGGLTADGVVWLFSRQKISDSIDFISGKENYFFLPNGLRIKAGNQVAKLMAQQQIAVLRTTVTSIHGTTPITEITDIPTGQLIQRLPTLTSKFFYEPTNQYFVGFTLRGESEIIMLYRVGQSEPMLRLSFPPGLTSTRIRKEMIKIDPYRRLIYLKAGSKFHGTANRVIIKPVLIVLRFNGTTVARYLIPDYFHIHIGPDLLITSEFNWSMKLNSLEEVNNSNGNNGDKFIFPPIYLPPPQLMPLVIRYGTSNIIAERDVENGWQPLAILAKVPTPLRSPLPRIIVSANGHYLLLSPPDYQIARRWVTPNLVYTRLHPLKEIELIRKALIGPPETDSAAKTSTSSTP